MKQQVLSTLTRLCAYHYFLLYWFSNPCLFTTLDVEIAIPSW